jgi:hypothetical protein
MAQIKFKVKQSAAILFSVLAFLYLGILVGLGIVPINFLPVWIMPVVFALMAIQVLFGMYTVIDDTYVQIVQYPFMNVRIPYEQITSVSLRGLPFFGNTVRVLFVSAKVKSISHFFFFDPAGVFRVCTDAAYGNEATASIIKAIQQRAPQAKIDPLARAFVDLVGSQKYKDSIPYKVLKAEEERIARR